MLYTFLPLPGPSPARPCWFAPWMAASLTTVLAEHKEQILQLSGRVKELEQENLDLRAQLAGDHQAIIERMTEFERMQKHTRIRQIEHDRQQQASAERITRLERDSFDLCSVYQAINPRVTALEQQATPAEATPAEATPAEATSPTSSAEEATPPPWNHGP